MLFFDLLIDLLVFRRRDKEDSWWEDVADKLPCKPTVPI